MTETAPNFPEAERLNQVAAGGGDPFFETDPQTITTPAGLQHHAATILAELTTTALPVCAWTIQAPDQHHVGVYTRGDLPALLGLAETADDVHTWGHHFGVRVLIKDGFVRAYIPTEDLIVEVAALGEPPSSEGDPL